MLPSKITKLCTESEGKQEGSKGRGRGRRRRGQACLGPNQMGTLPTPHPKLACGSKCKPFQVVLAVITPWAGSGLPGCKLAGAVPVEGRRVIAVSGSCLKAGAPKRDESSFRKTQAPGVLFAQPTWITGWHVPTHASECVQQRVGVQGCECARNRGYHICIIGG